MSSPLAIGAVSAVSPMAMALASAHRAVAITRACSGSGSRPVAMCVTNHTGSTAAIIVVGAATWVVFRFSGPLDDVAPTLRQNQRRERQ